MTNPQSDEFYREVEEDLHQKELREFWKENGNWIIGGIIAAILFTGGLSFYRSYEDKINTQQTAALLTAMDQADPAALMETAAAADKSHSVLARLAAARLHVTRGEKEQATVIYQEIANDTRFEDVIRDLARLYSVNLRLDTAPPDVLHAELAPLLGAENVWRFSARELQALIDLRDMKREIALDTFLSLANDVTAPPALRQRAQILHAFYTVQTDSKG